MTSYPAFLEIVFRTALGSIAALAIVILNVPVAASVEQRLLKMRHAF